MDGDFRTSFVREPGSLRQHPALVLNADYRPLSYYPLSLWPWQDAIKAVYLDRVDIVAEYQAVVRSPSIEIKIPSVVVLKAYVKPQKRVAFTRFNLFFARSVLLSILRGQGRIDVRSYRSAGARRPHVVGKCCCRLCQMQFAKGLAQPATGADEPAPHSATARCRRTAQ